MKYMLHNADAHTFHLCRERFINNDGYEYDLVSLNSRCLWSETLSVGTHFLS